ncbi:hypothetical protein ASE23_20380 [Rhizobium sp. Root73]|nr:hypothetical protein ASD36_23055 [Rhizobium sp. Root1334]KRC12715.1 hypothetical protein ASE23_20380 [Rhizobium sp. Root73]
MDMAGLDYVSSAGLRVMLKTAKASRAAKKKLVLAGLQPAVQEVFDISGFTALFVIVDTIEDGQGQPERKPSINFAGERIGRTMLDTIIANRAPLRARPCQS